MERFPGFTDQKTQSCHNTSAPQIDLQLHTTPMTVPISFTRLTLSTIRSQGPGTAKTVLKKENIFVGLTLPSSNFLQSYGDQNHVETKCIDSRARKSILTFPGPPFRLVPVKPRSV